MIFSDSYDRFLADLEMLVNIDSSSENLDGVATIARFFKERLAALGLDADIRFPGGAGVPCLLASTSGNNDRYDAMLLGHMDTVFPPGEAARRPFTIAGDQAFGPGVCDMKGGLLVALYALERLKKQGRLDRLSICVFFNGDEETGSGTSRDLIVETARKSRRVFVFEPCRPGMNLVVGRKGGGTYQVDISGKAAHAGADPGKGANAVLEAAHQIVVMDRLSNPEAGTTVQATVVHGGDRVNVIPDRASVSVDVRILSVAEKERVETFFRCLPEKTVVSGTRITVTGAVDRPPMETTAAGLALLERFRHQAAAMGVDLGSITTGGCSDGNFTAALGVPTLDGLGIVGSNAHREDEYAELTSVPVMVELVSSVLSGLASSDS